MAKRKPFSGLDCSASAEQMIRLVLSAQVKSMCKLRDKALDWNDPEGVHDMRVRSRRLRSAISDFKPFLRRSKLPRADLRTIADALGAVRDEDVAIAALDELQSKAKGRAVDGIKRLADEHHTRRKNVRAKLKTALRPAAIRGFQTEFDSKIRAVTANRVKKSRAKTVEDPMSFRTLGRAVILARIRELHESIHHLYFPFQIKELHALRILAKRLRYAVELFTDCWEGRLQDAGKEIALLQTSLGELHDCDVWLDTLGKRLRQTARKHKDDEATVTLRGGAVGLVRHFAKERTEHYRSALTRWEEWDSRDFLARLESSLVD